MSNSSSNRNSSQRQSKTVQQNRARARTTVVYRPFGTVLGSSMRTTLRYTGTANLFSGSSASTFGTTVVDLRLNDAFNPRLGTHQPYGWDQVMALYTRFKVERTRVKLTITPAVTSNPLVSAWVVYPPTNGTTIASTAIDEVLERPFTEYKTCLVGSGAPLVVSRVYHMHEIIGITKAQYDLDLDNYCGDSSTSPAKIVRMQLGVGDGVTTAQSNFAYFTFEIDYDVKVWLPKTVGQS